MNTHGFDTLRTICSTGSPLSPDGFRLVYDRDQGRRAPRFDRGRHRSVRLPRGPAIRPGRCARARSSAPCSGWPSTSPPTTARRSATRRVWRASSCAAQPFPSMPLGFWGDDSRRAVPRRVLRPVPRGLGARRLRVVDRARRHGHPRPQRRHAQSRWGTDRDRRDLPRRGVDARGARGTRVRPAVGRRRADRAARSAHRRCVAHRRTRRRDPRERARPRARRDTRPRWSRRSTTFRAHGATSSSSWRSPTRCTAGRCATPRPRESRSDRRDRRAPRARDERAG